MTERTITLCGFNVHISDAVPDGLVALVKPGEAKMSIDDKGRIVMVFTRDPEIMLYPGVGRNAPIDVETKR